ncbi:MAG: deoxyribodipyrimidine photolyase [Pirellulaceae bacterium]|nr:deoxyribodipyrimidine photolyase [Pirellulaceae bacterium]
MIACRRTTWNFALQRAAQWATQLRKPLVIFEPLRVGYQWASDRMHRFVLDGMADNAVRIDLRQQPGVSYFPYVESDHGAGQGLLESLAQQACCVVTDDYPCFFLPRMVAKAASRLPLQVEAVDSNGLLPLRATDRVFTTAFSFRAYLQKQLPAHLDQLPLMDPLADLQLPPLKSLPTEVLRRWPAASPEMLSGDVHRLAALPIDHAVQIAPLRGGTVAANGKLASFLDQCLAGYAAGANDPDADNRSGLSPYLHFGHISVHQVFDELMQRQNWTPLQLGSQTGGKREGWWGVTPGAEAWLDELVTWRELGFNMASHRADYDQYESLPDWAQATLAKHAKDIRPYLYSPDEFATAATHDPVWNAAQRQLAREGRMHNYMRMLWGKKILEWSPTPRDALETMVELNNRYALDGRDPNSYSGIFWTLGRYDRPWGPERPIFGTIRYMSSDNTRKKLKLNRYLETYKC